MPGEKGLYSGNLKKDYIRFAAPTMLAMMVYALYGMVDGLVVGRLVDARALAAVNFAAPMLSVFFALAALLGVGAGTLAAHRLGQGDTPAACRVFSQAVVSALVLGAAVSAGMLLFPGGLCRLLGASAEAMDYTREYILGLAPYAVFFIMEYTLETLIKTDGQPRLAAAAVIGGCCFNAVADWVFVAKFNLGVYGAGAASGISQLLVSLVFALYFLFSRRKTLRFTPFCFEMRLLGLQLRLGAADAVAEICTGVVTWSYNRVVLRLLGTGGVSAYTVLNYLNNVAGYTLLGAGQALEPLVSYHRGAGRPERCRRLLRCARVGQLAVALGLVAAVELLAEHIAAAFLGAAAPELKTLAAPAMRVFCLSFPVMGLNMVSASYLTAKGYAGRGLILSLGRGCVMQMLMLWILSALFGAEGIWWAALTAELLMAVLGFFLLRGKTDTLS